MSQTLRGAAFTAALDAANARPLARRAVRNGMDVQGAAWHATMGVMAFHAVGAVIILWFLVGFPVWLTALSYQPPLVRMLVLALIVSDFLTAGLFCIGTSIWAWSNPDKLTNWKYWVSRPAILLTQLVLFLPVHFILVIGFRIVFVGL